MATSPQPVSSDTWPYESVLVLAPDVKLADQKKFFQKLKSVIQTEFKGSICHIDTWGIRRLANKNKKKCRQGLYFHFSFKAVGGVVAELSRLIRMDNRVIYHHFEKLSPKKSLEEHLATFRQVVDESIKREKERLVRLQQKRKNFAPSPKSVAG